MIVIEDVDEFGDEDPGFAGASAHGQLVSEVANGGEAHAGNAEMLAERGNIFHVEFIERDDGIDGMGSGNVAYGINQDVQREIFGHGEDFVDAFERPRGIAKFFDGQKQNDTAHRFAGAEEFLALFVGADAENGERPALRHATPPGKRRVERGLSSGLARGIKKLEERADALRPGSFVVLRAFDDLVMQILSELPAFCEKHVAEFFDLRHDARTFARADIQPDARARLDHCSARKAVNYLVVPPHRWGERRNLPEDARMLESKIKRNEATERRAADAGVL